MCRALSKWLVFWHWSSIFLSFLLFSDSSSFINIFIVDHLSYIFPLWKQHSPFQRNSIQKTIYLAPRLTRHRHISKEKTICRSRKQKKINRSGKKKERTVLFFILNLEQMLCKHHFSPNEFSFHNTHFLFYLFRIKKKKMYFSPGGLSYNSTRSSSLFDCVCIARSRKGKKRMFFETVYFPLVSHLFRFRV